MGKEKTKCESCKYYCQTCPVLPCGDCSEMYAVPDSKWEAYTKADWIRSLSDEELASYIAGLITGYAYNGEADNLDKNYKKVLSSIKEPFEKMPYSVSGN